MKGIDKLVVEDIGDIKIKRKDEWIKLEDDFNIYNSEGITNHSYFRVSFKDEAFELP
jgi:hypothetical protein